MGTSNIDATRTRPARSSLQAAWPELILASGSEARLSLLRSAGLGFTVRSPMVDEDAAKREARSTSRGPSEVALHLAELKAGSVPAPDAIVMGADQLLVCGERWFDKPRDLASARDHLRALRGRCHVLYTAVALLRDGHPVWRHVATPRLRMRAFSDAALDAYLELEGERILGSVGAYRLEGPGVQLFEHVEGEHAAILGLPILALLAFLRCQGILLA